MNGLGDGPLADDEQQAPELSSRESPDAGSAQGITVGGDLGAQVRNETTEIVTLARVWAQLDPKLAKRVVRLTEERQKHEIDMRQREMTLKERKQQHEIGTNEEALAEARRARPITAVVVFLVLALIGLAIVMDASIVGIALVISATSVLLFSMMGVRSAFGTDSDRTAEESGDQ